MDDHQITNEHIRLFVEDFCERISRSYNDSIIDLVEDAPTGIVNYNNILLLKKAQKFVRHTDALFNKAISALFVALYRDKGIDAKTQHDRRVRCVFLNRTKEYIHFIPFEQFACFPKVDWFNGVSKASSANTFVVLVEKDSRGENLVQRANDYCPGPPLFHLIEDFVTDEYGEDIWTEMRAAFKQIEGAASRYQWFDLAEVCSDFNKEQFVPLCEKELLTKQYNLDVPYHHFQIIFSNFQKRYQVLLSDDDFARSYFTSEWLFHKQMRKDNLDKTYIVSGYLKSIEQLLSFCLRDMAGEDSIDILNGTSVQIASEDFAKATLGNMQHYIGSFEKRSVFDSRLSNRTIRLLNKQLAQWIKEERNGYFHKDNLSNVENVAQIRDSTYDIYLLLLGSLAVSPYSAAQQDASTQPS